MSCHVLAKMLRLSISKNRGSVYHVDGIVSERSRGSILRSRSAMGGGVKVLFMKVQDDCETSNASIPPRRGTKEGFSEPIHFSSFTTRDPTKTPASRVMK